MFWQTLYHINHGIRYGLSFNYEQEKDIWTIVGMVKILTKHWLDALVQDCSTSIANALAILEIR